MSKNNEQIVNVKNGLVLFTDLKRASVEIEYVVNSPDNEDEFLNFEKKSKLSDTKSNDITGTFPECNAPGKVRSKGGNEP